MLGPNSSDIIFPTLSSNDIHTVHFYFFLATFQDSKQLKTHQFLHPFPPLRVIYIILPYEWLHKSAKKPLINAPFDGEERQNDDGVLRELSTKVTACLLVKLHG